MTAPEDMLQFTHRIQEMTVPIFIHGVVLCTIHTHKDMMHCAIDVIVFILKNETFGAPYRSTNKKRTTLE